MSSASVQPPPSPSQKRVGRADLAAALALAGFVALLYAVLLFTNRVLAGGDILFYFYPYRDYVAAMLRQGEMPLWNPYIFLGVPLLANPQSAVLYPLHWPLIGLPVTAQVYWSAALHTWLLGLGGYVLLRVWGHSRGAALVSGLVLAGSGFYGGLIGHLNQMNGAAWLPWALAVLVWADAPGSNWRRRTRATAILGLLVALMLLAGHTQTVYINLFGLGVWAVWPVIAAGPVALQHRLKLPVLPQVSTPVAWRARLAQTGRRLLVYGVGIGAGALVAAPQLLPTVELSSRGLRQGGLTYAGASSFSLNPLYLLWTLLPSYGLVDLSVAFATLGYTEFVAYVGVLGLGLALWGAWRVRGPAWRSGLLLAALGFFLALGRSNPFYLLFYWLIPGFDLFRVPARWMMLYTLGMAILAGLGFEVLMQRFAGSPHPNPPQTGRELSQGELTAPSSQTAEGRGWGSAWLGLLLVMLVALDLLLAARALPHTQPTAPQAVYDLRTAPAHLLTDPLRRDLHPGAAGRFLSMSSLTFDPGDMGDYARILRDEAAPQLDGRAFDQLIVALKAQEIVAPNLALLWRIPSLDGFDGGVLPLARYLDLLTLFVPIEQRIDDGRLREQVQETPPADLLALYNVQYLITDKVRDLWYAGVYYDRQIGARLGPDRPSVRAEAPDPFAATHLHLIVAAEDDPAGASADPALPWLAVTLTGQTEAGAPTTATLTVTGTLIGPAALDAPLPATGGPQIAYRDVEGGRQEYLVALELPAIQTPTTLTLTWQADAPPITVQAATLVDARTGMFRALLPSDRGRYRLVHSGDVKLYENLDVLPRAYLVHTVHAAATADDAVTQVAAQVAGSGFDLRHAAVVEGLPGFTGEATAGDGATLREYSPESITVHTTSATAALLVLADTFDPGWRATVDGAPAPIYRTNVLLRGVPVPAGEHTVTFVYAPVEWRQGLGAGLVGLLLLAGLWILAWIGGPRAHDV